MKLHVKRLLALMALGATLALVAGESQAQTGGGSFPGQYGFAGNTNQGNSNLFAPPTGGPGPRSINPTTDNLPGNLGQPGIGGNTVKSLVGGAPAGVAAGAPAAGGPAAGSPAGGGPAAVAAPTAGGPAVGGAAVAGGGPAVGGAAAPGGAAVAGVAAGLSTVNPATILGNGFGGFPMGFNPSQFNQPSCRNVIDLLIRHCIGNRCFANNGQAGGAGPGFVGGGFGPMFPPMFPGQILGDLELMAVNVISDGAPNVGPMYQVTFRNNSQFAIQNFRISLVAVLGVINDFSPNITVTVPCVNAGEIGNVQIQLPANVMAMGVPTQPLVPFDTLVVAIDSFDQIMESNELNNVATLKRVGIPIVVATAPAAAATAVAPGATVAPVTPGAPGAQAAPANPVAPAPSGSDAVPAPTPSDNAVPTPTDKINLDNLDLGDTSAAATQTAM